MFSADNASGEKNVQQKNSMGTVPLMFADVMMILSICRNGISCLFARLLQPAYSDADIVR